MIARLVASLRGLLHRRRIDDEIAEELRDHLEREIESRMSRGASPQEARRLALRDLGGLTQTIESTRGVRATWLDTLWRDAAFGARVLGRSPRFTVIALALLVLGIGSTTAIFSITHAVLLRPLPYADPDRLVFITERDGNGVAWPTFEDWRRRAESFDGLASSLVEAVVVTSSEVPRRFESRSVTANFFDVLGVRPLHGRLFVEADARPDAPATAVVSHAFWMRELAGTPTAIGRTMSLNRRPFSVIGVLPPGFRFMTPADVYVLLEPRVAANFRGMQGRNTHTTHYAVGRLKPGVSVAAARAEMQTIMAALAPEYVGTNQKPGVDLVTLSDRIVGDTAPTLKVLAGAVALLLLIACVNLASLLLNRSASRGHEFNIRAAIGGSRWTLIRQLLIEQALLVVTGGVLGALGGVAILAGLLRVAPRELPRLDEIHPDVLVLSLTTVVCCACAFVFAIVPALKASGVSGHSLALRSGRGTTRSSSSLGRGLMMVEVAVATVLLSGAGLMVHTMVRLARVDAGFDPHNLQTFAFSLSGPQWPDERKQIFYDAVAARLRAVPGVENAAITYSLLGSNWWNVFTIAGASAAAGGGSSGDLPNAGMAPVSAGYFETLKIPLVKGRFFDRTDTPNSLPVAIVNTSLARKYWPDEDPIGKQVRQGNPSSPFGPWRTIVGVVGDTKVFGVDQEAPQQLFMPIVQQPRTTVIAVARTRGPVAGSLLESVLHDLDRTVPVFNDRTMDQLLREASSRRRIAAVVLSVFGSVAVLLAAIGVYGLIAQGVTERRREIGVRIALGATSSQVVRLFLRHGLVVVVIGVTGGVVVALAAAKSLGSLVFGVTVTDPATFGAVAALLAGITLLACYVPALFAARVDPVEALRAE